MVNTFCLDPTYSTTRLITRTKPVLVNAPDAVFPSRLFLPEGKGRSGEGGLRTNGYFKRSFSDKPLITVITVVLNCEQHLENTIKSVISQKYDNIEYIIVDGGSADMSLNIIKRYEGQIDYWVSEKDNGIYDAMNKAVSVAQGEWCYFLGADDILLDEYSLFVEKAKESTCIYYANVLIKKYGHISGGIFNKYKLMQQNICQQAILYPLFIFKYYRFNLKYKLLSDYCLNIFLFCKYKFKHLDYTIAVFDDEGASCRLDKAFNDDLNAIILANFGIGCYIIKLVRSYIAKKYKQILSVMRS